LPPVLAVRRPADETLNLADPETAAFPLEKAAPGSSQKEYDHVGTISISVTTSPASTGIHPPVLPSRLARRRHPGLHRRRVYLDKRFPTLAKAAEACGSNVQYVRAAVVMMVRESVLVGHVPLLAAANLARQRQKAERVTVDEAVTSWRKWTPEQRADFGRGAGIADVWDYAIAPAITNPPVVTFTPVITEEREVVS
jgi:hypothetical protein